tara:strand:- start:1584 stop:1751 length:168 start_codon:yes stop_codon:yes gene_type:complete
MNKEFNKIKVASFIFKYIKESKIITSKEEKLFKSEHNIYAVNKIAFYKTISKYLK